jgi:hypothetical protein
MLWRWWNSLVVRADFKSVERRKNRGTIYAFRLTGSTNWR